MRGTVVAGAVVAALLSVPAAAHETQVTGAQRLTLGWAEEPALTGMPNSVEVALADAAGAPVAATAASLRVEVSFGAEVRVLALQPSATPGTFSAPLVPTRAGTYAFHVTGTVGGQAVDITSTCSEQTFDCVTDAGDAQFPAEDPSVGELAARAEQDSRRADRAEAAAAEARMLATVAVVVAGIALSAAVASGLALRRWRRRP